MTGPTLRSLFPNLTPEVADLYAKHLTAAMGEFDINTVARQAAFLAQIGHESHGLTRWVENLNYKASRLLAIFPRYFTAAQAEDYAGHPERIANRVYANRMGNGDEQSGDGWKFRGRSPIQLTGRENYGKAGEALSRPLEATPDIAAHEDTGFRLAGWYWASRGLNELADAGQHKSIRKRVNGGTIGLAECLALTERFHSALA